MAIRAKGYENRKGTKRLQITMDKDEGKRLAGQIPASAKGAIAELKTALTEATR